MRFGKCAKPDLSVSWVGAEWSEVLVGLHEKPFSANLQGIY
jgi:hypothetical protein